MRRTRVESTPPEKATNAEPRERICALIASSFDFERCARTRISSGWSTALLTGSALRGRLLRLGHASRASDRAVAGAGAGLLRQPVRLHPLAGDDPELL